MSFTHAINLRDTATVLDIAPASLTGEITIGTATARSGVITIGNAAQTTSTTTVSSGKVNITATGTGVNGDVTLETTTSDINISAVGVEPAGKTTIDGTTGTYLGGTTTSDTNTYIGNTTLSGDVEMGMAQTDGSICIAGKVGRVGEVTIGTAADTTAAYSFGVNSGDVYITSNKATGNHQLTSNSKMTIQCKGSTASNRDMLVQATGTDAVATFKSEAGPVLVHSGTSMDVNSDGTLNIVGGTTTSLNSSAGEIEIATTQVGQELNIGTNTGRTAAINIGDSAAAAIIYMKGVDMSYYNTAFTPGIQDVAGVPFVTTLAYGRCQRWGHSIHITAGLVWSSRGAADTATEARFVLMPNSFPANGDVIATCDRYTFTTTASGDEQNVALVGVPGNNHLVAQLSGTALNCSNITVSGAVKYSVSYLTDDV